LEELEASVNNKTPVLKIEVVFVDPPDWEEDDGETLERPSHDRKVKKDGRAA
jgi:hypothetical protein